MVGVGAGACYGAGADGGRAAGLAARVGAISGARRGPRELCVWPGSGALQTIQRRLCDYQTAEYERVRFGIEWSRLEPEEGKWNKEAIEHYRRYIRILRKNDIEPFATLWHWTMPTWFTDKGGFAKKENIRYFERFVQKVADELADDLRYVITLNEPNVYVALSYLMGEWPPQEKKPFMTLKVYWHLAQAHKRAYKVLRQSVPGLQVGVAMNVTNFQPKRPGKLVDRIGSWLGAYTWNWWFLRRIRGQQDFVGVNYYMNERIRGFRRKTPKKPANDLGWYMKPVGILPVLTDTWRRFKRPIIITENGLADEGDEHRRWWLEQTIVAMGKARKQGVDLWGYLHWSLLDNFEWKFGWWPKFGLVAVDRKHGMKRTVRPSAKWFAAYIKKVRGLS